MRLATLEEQDRIMAVKQRVIASIQSEMISGEVSKEEALCLFAYVTGMLIAFQDQTKMTGIQAMEIVGMNIEAGNASAIEQAFEGIGKTLN